MALEDLLTNLPYRRGEEPDLENLPYSPGLQGAIRNLPLVPGALGQESPLAGLLSQIGAAPPPPAPARALSQIEPLVPGEPEPAAEAPMTPGTGILDRLKADLQQRLGSLALAPSTQMPNVPGATVSPSPGLQLPTTLPEADAAADAIATGAPSPYAGPAPEPIKGSGKIVRLASTQIGSPYVWATIDPVGGGSAGFDCSGLTRWVYSKFGVELPHLSEGQRQATAPVSREDLRPGDLVFFHYTNRNGPGAADHVGIYMNPTTMIDAGSGGVERSPIDWSAFIGGGRVPGDSDPEPAGAHPRTPAEGDTAERRGTARGGTDVTR